MPLHRLGAHGPRVAQDAVAHLRHEVEAPPAVFDDLDHAKALLVVAIKPFHARVVGRNAHMPRDGARNLRNLERVREARAEMVAFRRKEHLRLVRQAAKAFRVDYLVAIALVFSAQQVGVARLRAAFGLVRKRHVGRQGRMLASHARASAGPRA